jgi:hypothetical protein
MNMTTFILVAMLIKNLTHYCVYYLLLLRAICPVNVIKQDHWMCKENKKQTFNAPNRKGFGSTCVEVSPAIRFQYSANPCGIYRCQVWAPGC